VKDEVESHVSVFTCIIQLSVVVRCVPVLLVVLLHNDSEWHKVPMLSSASVCNEEDKCCRCICTGVYTTGECSGCDVCVQVSTLQVSVAGVTCVCAGVYCEWGPGLILSQPKPTLTLRGISQRQRSIIYMWI